MKNKQSLSECKEHVVKYLSWKTSQKDDKAFAKELHDSKIMDAVYTLNDLTYNLTHT